jgi:hypothetical protein
LNSTLETIERQSFPSNLSLKQSINDHNDDIDWVKERPRPRPRHKPKLKLKIKHGILSLSLSLSGRFEMLTKRQTTAAQHITKK